MSICLSFFFFISLCLSVHQCQLSIFRQDDDDDKYCQPQLPSVTIMYNAFCSFVSQTVFSAVFSLLSSLNLPLIPRCDPAAPRTPPRDPWNVDGDLSALQHSSALSDSASDDPLFVPGPPGLEHSPSFTHRYNAHSATRQPDNDGIRTALTCKHVPYSADLSKALVIYLVRHST